MTPPTQLGNKMPEKMSICDAITGKMKLYLRSAIRLNPNSDNFFTFFFFFFFNVSSPLFLLLLSLAV
jgi:hypothetical protein